MGILKQEKTEPFTSATHILRNCCNELAWKELYDSGQEDEEDNASGYTAQTPIVSSINEALRVVLKVRNDPHRMGTCMSFPVRVGVPSSTGRQPSQHGHLRVFSRFWFSGIL